MQANLIEGKLKKLGDLRRDDPIYFENSKKVGEKGDEFSSYAREKEF